MDVFVRVNRDCLYRVDGVSLSMCVFSGWCLSVSVSLDPLDALDALSLSICILKSRGSAFGPSSHWTQFLY